MTIQLKCWPEAFDAIASGRKRCDVRHIMDRTFSVGDVLLLVRWNPWFGDATTAPAWARVRVTWIDKMAGDLPILGGLDADERQIVLVVMSFELLEAGAGAPPSE